MAGWNIIQTLCNNSLSFSGDLAGEIDTRFSFCAIATLHFLGRLDAIDVVKAIEFIRNCYNFDGGFGTRPGSESHAGQVYSFHYAFKNTIYRCIVALES